MLESIKSLFEPMVAANIVLAAIAIKLLYARYKGHKPEEPIVARYADAGSCDAVGDNTEQADLRGDTGGLPAGIHDVADRTWIAIVQIAARRMPTRGLRISKPNC